MRPCPPSRKSESTAHSAEKGYVLITLILFVALLAIGLVALAPVITQQIKRDREAELIHRGTQYSRAIKHYMKKFNSYPTTIEALEKTNEVRFLRKRYKDPITGKDFKLLHQNEVQISLGPGIAGANSVASLAAGATGGATTAFGGSGVFGAGSGNSGSAFGGNSGSAFGGNSGSTFGGNSGSTFGGNSGSSFGGNSGSSFGGNSSGTFGSTFGGPQGQTPSNGTDSGSDVGSNQPPGSAGTPTGQGGFGQPVQGLSGFNAQGNGSNQVFGGGPIVGVVSLSKDKAIRSFNKKDHYNDWQFIYDPSTDRGGLISTPNQPSLVGGIQGLAGAPGANGTSGAPAPGAQGTQSSPFGFGSGPQNSPGGFGAAPQQPQAPPNQSPQ
jgi:type II secretory pathway pseudopilin PulG